MLESNRFGRSSPCVLGPVGSYHVRVETSVDDALVFSWRRGRRVYDSLGREVMRVMIHPEDAPHVLLRDPATIMDAITNHSFSILSIERIFLVVFDFSSGMVDVLSLKECVVWPAAHRKSA